MSGYMNAVDLQLELSTSTPSSFLGSVSGSNSAITVSSTLSTTIYGQPGFVQWFQPITATSGSGAYTRKIVLDRTTYIPSKGATFEVDLSLAASNNITIEIYDGTDTGTLLQQVKGDSSNTTEFAFEAEYNGTVWVKTEGEYL